MAVQKKTIKSTKKVTEKVVSFDAGSGRVKVGTDQGRTLLFPSVVTLGEGNGSFCVDSKSYLIGESALAALNTKKQPVKPNIDEHYHGSEEQTAMICYVFERLEINGEIDKLVRSVPYDFAKERPELISELKAQTEFTWTIDDKERTVNVKEVEVIAQGAGCLMAWQFGYYGETIEPAPRIVQLAEIGSVSCDRLNLEYDRFISDYQYKQGGCDSNREYNVNWFINEFKKNLKSSFADDQITINSYHDISRYFIKNDFLFPAIGEDKMPKKIDVTRCFEKTKKAFTSVILDCIRSNDLSLYSMSDIILIGGGGSHLLDKNQMDKESGKNIVYLDAWGDMIGQLLVCEEIKDIKQLIEKLKESIAQTEATQ